MHNRVGVFTEDGLARLAEIVRNARGKLSYRQFEEKLGGKPKHATLRRFEIREVKNPDYSTLERLAPVTGYTASALFAIACGKEEDVVRFTQTECLYRVAEDVMAVAARLSDVEMVRLRQLLLAELAKREVFSCASN